MGKRGGIPLDAGTAQLEEAQSVAALALVSRAQVCCCMDMIFVDCFLKATMLPSAFGVTFFPEACELQVDARDSADIIEKLRVLQFMFHDILFIR
jgi:hypothetical protein